MSASPRTLKRFANLFRFYRLAQCLRPLRPEVKEKPAATRALVRWLVAMVCWPQLVRWVQWEAESTFLAGTSPQERIDDWESKLLQSVDYSDWLKKVTDMKMHVLPWCVDARLFKFVRERSDEIECLRHALEYGVW